jgi:hypothetical protein
VGAWYGGGVPIEIPSPEAINAFIAREFPSAHATGNRCVEMGREHAVVRWTYDPAMLRPGGFISGPIQFALADSALWFLTFTVLGLAPMAPGSLAPSIAGQSPKDLQVRGGERPRPSLAGLLRAQGPAAALQTQRTRSQTTRGHPSGPLHPDELRSTMHHHCLPWASAFALLVTAGTAHAVEPSPVPATDAPPDKASAGDGGVELADSSVGGKVDTGPKADNTRTDHKSDVTPWIKRYRPTAHQLEGGIYGGVLLPQLGARAVRPAKDVAVVQEGRRPTSARASATIRCPSSASRSRAALMPTKLRDGSSRALLGAFRGYGCCSCRTASRRSPSPASACWGPTAAASATTSTRRCTSAAA